MALIGERDNSFQLWALQASLLVCYFGAFSGDSQRETRAAQTLSETMKVRITMIRFSAWNIDTRIAGRRSHQTDGDIRDSNIRGMGTAGDSE